MRNLFNSFHFVSFHHHRRLLHICCTSHRFISQTVLSLILPLLMTFIMLLSSKIGRGRYRSIFTVSFQAFSFLSPSCFTLHEPFYRFLQVFFFHHIHSRELILLYSVRHRGGLFPLSFPKERDQFAGPATVVFISVYQYNQILWLIRRN